MADVFFQRLMRPRLFKCEIDTQRVARLLDSALPEVFDYLTGCLGGDEFMVSDGFSLADIAIASPFINFALAGGVIDANLWPEFANYIQRVHAQPCYAPIVKADLEGPFADAWSG